MIEFKTAKVCMVDEKYENMSKVSLDIDHDIVRAINYDDITGEVYEGDEVLVNTTAATLGLGTGGYHFIMGNLSKKTNNLNGAGHCMKLKYTPIQSKFLFAEEEDSPIHKFYNESIILDNKLIFVGELHSMLPPLCALLKYCLKDKIKISYIMTDHGALPISFSNNVREIKGMRLLDTTITTGNAFGGDYECVNIYTALKTALNIEKSQVCIITMGPGIVGTNTKYGFSGLELGMIADFIANKGGNCVYIPRVSFSDKRNRHNGISHHSITVLKEIINNPMKLYLPCLQKNNFKYILRQIKENKLNKSHQITFLEGNKIKHAMHYFKINTSIMGRGLDIEPAFYYGIGAAGIGGLNNLKQ